jgi:hypothetical protein
MSRLIVISLDITLNLKDDSLKSSTVNHMIHSAIGEQTRFSVIIHHNRYTHV